jgi:anti-anti-sigma factor
MYDGTVDLTASAEAESAWWVQGASGPAVTIVGELDSTSFVAVMNVLLDAVFEGTGDITVDMTGVTFMDAAGFHALESARAWLDRRRSMVVRTSAAVRRLLEAVGSPHHLDLVNDLALSG